MMRLLILASWLIACTSGGDGRPSTTTEGAATRAARSPASAVATSGELTRLVPHVVLEGHLRLLHRSPSRWGGEQLALAVGDLTVRVDVGDVDTLRAKVGEVVSLRGTLGAADPHSLPLHAGPQGPAEEPIPTPLVLLDATVAPSGAGALADSMAVTGAVREKTIRATGTLRSLVDERGEQNFALELDDETFLPVWVVAEATDETRARVGTRVTLEGALRVDREVPKPLRTSPDAAPVFVIDGIALTMPRIISAH